MLALVDVLRAAVLQKHLVEPKSEHQRNSDAVRLCAFRGKMFVASMPVKTHAQDLLKLHLVR